MSLYEKYLKLMKECNYVQRLGYNKDQNYKYSKAANVSEKINEALIRLKIIPLATPEIIKSQEVTTARGSIAHLITIKMTVKLIDIESQETMEISAYGSGQDLGDKAILKAQTSALKYVWINNLQMASGDDPEADISTDESSSPTNSKPQPKNQTQAQNKSLSESQIKRFYAIIKDKASPEVISLIIDNQIPNRRLNGKINWDAVSKVEYNKLCYLFESGEWHEAYKEIMEKAG